MFETTFQRELLGVRARRYAGDQPDYCMGYERGLMRGFFGSNYGTNQEHELWLSFAAESNASLRECGRGYRDGLAVATAVEAA